MSISISISTEHQHQISIRSATSNPQSVLSTQQWASAKVRNLSLHVGQNGKPTLNLRLPEIFAC